jgi:MarR family transcriptional regulator, transcriptional regulator for hemolysin
MTLVDRRKSAGYMTNRAARLFATAMDRRLADLGLSSGQLPVLLALAGGNAMSQKALTEDAAIQQPTMAATLSRMERDGLVETRPDPDDKRSTLYSLTPNALAKCEAVGGLMREINGAALAGLGETERGQYLAMLEHIVAALELELDGRQ